MDANMNTTNAGQEIFDLKPETPEQQQLLEEGAQDALANGQGGGEVDIDNAATEGATETYEVEDANSHLLSTIPEEPSEGSLAIDTLIAEQHGNTPENAGLNSSFSDCSSDYERRSEEEDEQSEESSGQHLTIDVSAAQELVNTPEKTGLSSAFSNSSSGQEQGSEEGEKEEREQQDEGEATEPEFSPRTRKRLQEEASRGYHYYDVIRFFPFEANDDHIEHRIFPTFDFELRHRKEWARKPRSTGGQRMGNLKLGTRTVAGLGENAPRFPSPLNPRRLALLRTRAQIPSSPPADEDQHADTEWEDVSDSESLATVDCRGPLDINELQSPTTLGTGSIPESHDDLPPRPEARMGLYQPDGKDWIDVDEDDDEAFDFAADAQARFQEADRRNSVDPDSPASDGRRDSVASDFEEVLPKVALAGEPRQEIYEDAPVSPGAQSDDQPITETHQGSPVETQPAPAKKDLNDAPAAPASPEMLEALTGMSVAGALDFWSKRQDSGEPLSDAEKLARNRDMIAWEQEIKLRENGGKSFPLSTEGQERFRQFLAAVAYDFRGQARIAQEVAANHLEQAKDYWCQLQDAERDNDELLRERESNRRKYNELYDAYKSSQRQLEDLQNGMQATEHYAAEERKKYEELEAKYNEQLGKCSKCSNKDEQTVADIGDLQITPEDKSCESCARLEQELAEQKRKTKSFEDSWLEYEALYEKETNASAILEKELLDLKEQLDAAQLKVQKAEKRAEQYKAWGEKQNADAEETRRRKERESNFPNADAETQTLDDDIHNAENDRLQSAEALWHEVEEVQATLVNSDSELETERQRNADLEAEKEELQRQLAELRAEKADVDDVAKRSNQLLNDVMKSPAIQKALVVDFGGEEEGEEKVVPEPAEEEPIFHHNNAAIEQQNALRIFTQPQPLTLAPRTPRAIPSLPTPMTPRPLPSQETPMTSIEMGVPTPALTPLLSPRPFIVLPSTGVPAARVAEWRNTEAYRRTRAIAQIKREQEKAEAAELEQCKKDAYARTFGKPMKDHESPSDFELMRAYAGLGLRRYVPATPILAVAA